jgi:hypothetical protein
MYSLAGRRDGYCAMKGMGIYYEEALETIFEGGGEGAK